MKVKFFFRGKKKGASSEKLKMGRVIKEKKKGTEGNGSR